MPIVSRVLTFTQGNIDNSHLYLTDAMEIFPADSIGGEDEARSAPRTVRVMWGSESVDTDVVRSKNIFRKRGWVSQFFREAGIRAGDQVLLEQLDPYTYRVSLASSP